MFLFEIENNISSNIVVYIGKVNQRNIYDIAASSCLSVVLHVVEL